MTTTKKNFAFLACYLYPIINVKCKFIATMTEEKRRNKQPCDLNVKDIRKKLYIRLCELNVKDIKKINFILGFQYIWQFTEYRCAE